MESEYLQKLLSKNPHVGASYRAKLKPINDLDPFTLSMQDLDYSTDGIPPVTNMDITVYLFLTHSYCSKEQMKNFKNLQAYNYFKSGFILKLGTKVVNDFYILVGKVKHAQTANLKPLDVWCIISKDGGISTAHCTCMTGISEVCSHIGAILFATEYANNKKEAISCTDAHTAWPLPPLSSPVPIVPVHEMNWGTIPVAHQENKDMPRDIPPMSNSELVSMLEKLSQLGCKSALMRIVEPFASRLSEEAADSSNMEV